MAGGKVLVGGTAYDITKGKTMIGGTAYDITAGKTLVSGTAEDIVFAKPLPSLDDLFADMTIVATAGRNASSNSTVRIQRSYAPSSGVCYLIVVRPNNNGSFTPLSISIFKVKDRSVVENIYVSNFAGFNYAGYYQQSTYWYYATDPAATAYTSVRGATLAIVTFPSKYSEAEVDGSLKLIDAYSLASAYSSSSTNLSTSSTRYSNVICTKAANIDFWSTNGGVYTKLNGTSTAAGVVSSSNLQVTSVYAGTIIGIQSNQS